MPDSTTAQMAGQARRWKEGLPEEPYPGYPLSPHRKGTWCKKINGRMYHFGRWYRTVGGERVLTGEPGWRDALRSYHLREEELKSLEGAPIPPPRRKITVDPTKPISVKELCNEFLEFKSTQVESGEMAQSTFHEYRKTAERLCHAFRNDYHVADLRSKDFGKLRAEMSKRWGLVKLSKEIQMIRTILKFGHDNDLIPKPVNVTQFRKPKAKSLEEHRNDNPKKLFEPAELRRLLDALEGKPITVKGKDKPVVLRPDLSLRAIVLLGINCGFGNTDCAELPITALNLDAGLISFPRPKTAAKRQCALWPETVAALRVVLEQRPVPRTSEWKNLVFVRPMGGPWVIPTDKSRIDYLSHKFTDVLREIDVYHPERGFYTLRHTFRTVADNSRDFVACNLVMGHKDSSMAAVYRHGIEPARLIAVADTVRQWLFVEGGAV